VVVELTKSFVTELLKEKSDILKRTNQINALVEIGGPVAIEALIVAFGNEYSSDLFEERLDKGLTKLTGKSFGNDKNKWSKWWEENKEKYINESK